MCQLHDALNVANQGDCSRAPINCSQFLENNNGKLTTEALLNKKMPIESCDPVG